MRWLDHVMESLVWRPSGLVRSLAQLEAKHGLLAQFDVTPQVMGAAAGSRPLTVAELAGGKVVADLRLAVTRENVVVGGMQSIFADPEAVNHYALRRRRWRLPRYRRGTALLLGVSNGDNYYHWMLDALPRWHLAQAAGLGDYERVALIGCAWECVVLLKNVGCSSEWA